ncbi:MAG: hypothetical protein ACYS83_05870, partial [Planctomycetota bacterium]
MKRIHEFRVVDSKVRLELLKDVGFAICLLGVCCVGLAMATIGLAPRYADAQKGATVSRLSERDLFAYLPEGAKLADVPFVQFGRSGETEKTRPSVLYADVDADGEEEIIVAYYAPPHDYIVDGQPQEEFFRRA